MKKIKYIKHIPYLALLLIAIYVVIWGGNTFSPDNKWFTIIISIGCGGISSVLVAWFIDLQNSKVKKLEENLELFNLRRFFLSEIIVSCSSMLGVISSSVIITNKLPENKKYTWHKWFCIFANQLNKTPENHIDVVIDVFSKFKNSVEKAIENEAIYIINNILDKNELFTLMEIKDDISYLILKIKDRNVDDTIKTYEKLYANMREMNSVFSFIEDEYSCPCSMKIWE